MSGIRRAGAGALLAAAVAAISACGSHSMNHTAASTSAAAASSPPHVSNPFTIVARYSAASLGLHNPRDLAIGPDGNLYITDATDRVTVVSPEGKVLRRWGSKGSGPGEFDFVTGDLTAPNQLNASIATGPGGKVYVIDSGNSRVEVFSSTGKFIRSFGSYGLHNGQFQAPLDAAADPAGDVYVADDQAETLSKFSAAGRFEWGVGGPGTTDPDLLGHFHSLSVDSHNRVIAAVDDAHAVVYLDSAGNKVDSFSLRGYYKDDWGPCAVTLTPSGDTVVESCPGAPTGPPGRPYLATLLFDRTHRLVGAWYHSPFSVDVPPRFGPHGEVFALASTVQQNGFERATGGSILRLKVALPGA